MTRIRLIAAGCAVVGVAACATTTDPVEEVVEPAVVETVAIDPAEAFEQEVGSRVYFDFDSATLSSDARSTLGAQAAWLSRADNAEIRILIAGNADERGTTEYNQGLGEKRAQAAVDYLLGAGIDAGRIEMISYGENAPVDSASNESAWAKNRNAQSVLILAGS